MIPKTTCSPASTWPARHGPCPACGNPADAPAFQLAFSALDHDSKDSKLPGIYLAIKARYIGTVMQYTKFARRLECFMHSHVEYLCPCWYVHALPGAQGVVHCASRFVGLPTLAMHVSQCPGFQPQALQVEEAYIGAQDFCARVRQEEAAVLRAEPTVLQALRFDLITYSPYRALTGFLMARPAQP